MSNITYLTGTIWSTVTGPSGNFFHLSSSSDYLFGLTSYPGNNTLYKINLQNPSLFSTLINNQVLYAAHQSNDSSYVYLPNYVAGGLIRYDFSGNKDNSWSCSTSGNGTTGVCVDGNYLYIGYQNLGYITQANISNGSIVNTTWATLPQRSQGLFILDGYMYVNSDIGGAIYKIQMNYGNNPPTAGTINTNFINYGFSSIAGYSNGYSNLIFGVGGTNEIYVFDAFAGTLLRILNITNAISGLSPSGIAVATINSIPYLFFGDINIFQFSMSSIYSYLKTNNETLWSSTGQTNFGNPSLHIFGGYMYLTKSNGNNQGLYRNTFPTPTTWTKTISGEGLCGMDNDGTYLYLTSTVGTTISGGFVRTANGTSLDNTWYVNNSNTYYQLIIKDGYIYTNKYNSGVVSRITISDLTFVNDWADIKPVLGNSCRAYGITAVGNNFYVNTNTPSAIVKIPILPTTPPTSGTITILDTSANDPYFSNIDNVSSCLTNYFNQSLIMGFLSISGGYTNIIRQYDLAGNLLPPIISVIPVTKTFHAICMNEIFLYAFNSEEGNVYQYQLGSVSLAGSFTMNGFRYIH
jgi:hypothetical protein